MMQLGIHNRETRYSEKSFRNLGTIPKLSPRYYRGKDAGLRRMKDYHTILGKILTQIKDTNGCGLQWVFRWKSKFHRVILRPYLLAILGDYPGHNMICGKMGGNNKISKCRTCRCPNDHLSSSYRFSKIKREDYTGDSVPDSDLAAISMHRIDNAIENLPYGPCRYGVCGLCHGETVHIIQGGVEDRLLQGLQEATIVSLPGRKRQAEQFDAEAQGWFRQGTKRIRLESGSLDCNDEETSETEEINEGTTNEAKTKKNSKKTLVLGGKIACQFNAIGTFVANSLSQQSNRDLPPMPHSKGILNTSKTTSSEKEGLLLLYLIILCSTYGSEKLASRFGKMRMAYTIEVIEIVMCLEELCKDTRGFPKELAVPWKKFWFKFKPLFCQITNRQTGDGNNLVKLHMIDHLPEVSLMYGSPANISGGPGENNQKVQKAAGRRTQMNESVFAMQQATKLYEMGVIKSAIGHLRGPKFQLVLIDGDVRLIPKGRLDDFDSASHTHSKSLLRYARDKWKGAKLDKFEDIDIYTELRKVENGVETLYRSDFHWQPHLHKSHLHRHRADWALFRWLINDEELDIPAKMVTFLKLDKNNAWLIDDSSLPDGSAFVLVHSLSAQPNNYFDLNKAQEPYQMAHPASRLVFKGELEMDKEKKTLPLNQMLPAKNIVGPATVLQDFCPVFANKDTTIKQLVQNGDPGHEHIFLRDRRQWSDVIQSVIMDTYAGCKTVFPEIH